MRLMLAFVLDLMAVVIGMFGIVGNATAFMGFKQQSKKTSTSFLFQVLAVADSLVILTTLPYGFVFDFNEYMQRNLEYRHVEDKGRKILIYIQLILFPLSEMTILASISVTVLLAVTRLIAVYFPMRARRLCRIARMRRSVAAVAIFAIVFNVLPYFTLKPITVTYGNRTLTRMHLRSNSAKYYFWFITYGRPVVYCAMPLLLITVITIALILKLRSLDKRRAALTQAERLHNKSTRVLIVVLVVFFVCSLPYPLYLFCLHFLYRYTASYVRYFVLPMNFFYIVNSSVNVLIYTSLSKQYCGVISQVCSRPAASRIEMRPRYRETAAQDRGLKLKSRQHSAKCIELNQTCREVPAGDIEIQSTCIETPAEDIEMHQTCRERSTDDIEIHLVCRRKKAVDEIEIYPACKETLADDIEMY